MANRPADQFFLAPDEVQEVVLRYRPSEIPIRLWHETLGDFVRAVVIESLEGPVKPARLYMTMLLAARLTYWSINRGLPLKADVIFEPENIERWTKENRHSKSASTHRAVLRRVAAHYHVPDGWRAERVVLRESEMCPPYSPDEVAFLWDYAEGQSTPRRRRTARTLLALGLGAGLTGAAVSNVRARDVQRRGRVVVIATAVPKARLIPVLVRYGPVVLDLAKGLDPADYLGGPAPSHTSSGTAYMAHTLDVVGPTDARPIDVRRLRATWILEHLEARTPLNALFLAAGLTQAGPIGRFLPWMKPLSEADYIRLLSNPK